MGRLVEGAAVGRPRSGSCSSPVISGLVKPDPEIYRHLLDNLGAEPTEVAFLDDRADNIAGAIASGIHGFVFTDAAQARADLRSAGVRHPA